MVFVLDNFLDPFFFKIVDEEIRKMKFYTMDNDPHILNNYDEGSIKKTIYPGSRTEDMSKAHPLLDYYLIRQIERSGSPFVKGNWEQNKYAYLRLADDEKMEYRHTDSAYDWAYLIYMSATNLDSGTKFFESEEVENLSGEITTGVNVKDEVDTLAGVTDQIAFIQNRLVMFDCNVPHRAWGDHGTTFEDGRLTINGFGNYR